MTHVETQCNGCVEEEMLWTVRQGSDPRLGQLERGVYHKCYREPLRNYISKIMVPVIPISGQCDHISIVAIEVF